MRKYRGFATDPFGVFLSCLLSLSLTLGGVSAAALAEELNEGEVAPVAEGDASEGGSSDAAEGLVEGDVQEEEPADGVPTEAENEALAAGAGESDVLVEQEDKPLVAQSDDIVASGKWGTCPWEIDALGAMTIHPGKGADTTGSDSPWKDYSAIVTSVVFAEENGKKVVAPKNCGYLFGNFRYVKSINASGLDTSQVTNMSSFFSGCNSLVSLDTSGWQVMSVTNMTSMFTSCNKLSTVDVSNWNVVNVADMSYMFSYCYALSDVDVSKWSTGNVRDMTGLFYACRSLRHADVSHMNVRYDNNGGRICTTDKMFYGCTMLESVDLSSWCEDRDLTWGWGGRHNDMFVDCTGLKSFTVGKTFPFYNAKDIPVPTSSTGKWWSRQAKQWFTVEQIHSSRKGIADTYLNYQGIGFDEDVARAKVFVVDQTYDGTAQEPSIAVALDGVALVKGTDYTASYSNNVDVGTAYVTINGKGKYAGELVYPFAIKPKAITVTADSLSKEWGAEDPKLTATVSGLVGDDTISYNLLREPGEDVGNYVIAAEGAATQGNYKVTYKRATFTITNATVEVPTPAQLTYNGQEQRGVPEGTGYTLSGTVAATDAGSYEASATPDANHRWPDDSTDAKTISWTIEPKDIAEASIGDIVAQAYTGAPVTPQATVSLGDATLRSGTDYETSYSNNTKVGTATVTVTGTGNYTGTTTSTFEIVPASIEGAAITAPEPQTYTGKPLTPAVTVRFGDSTLTSGVDYTLEYANNTAAGTATVTVTGKNNLEGSTKVTFAINRATATVTALDQSKTYGAADPDLKARVSGIVDDYKPVYTVSRDPGEDVGSYAITPSGAAEQGNYLVTYEPGTLTIEKASLSTASVSVVGGAQTYTGSALMPRLEVKVGNKELKAGTDYTVAYGSNVNAGTARATVTGIGNYSGSKAVSFTIIRASLSAASVRAANATYTGSAVKPDVTVTWDGRTLVSGRDYTVSYEGNVDAGTASATLTGKGNFEGTADAVFKISPASISEAVVARLNDMTYTGRALTPEPTVTFNGITLRKGTDYSVAYANNTAMGTATVTLTGKGNFTGTTSTTFKIVAASLADATVRVDDATYTGTACKPMVTVAWGGKTLKAGTDYTVAYGSNVNAGTGRVTVTGKGNYAGTNAATFTIAAAPLFDATVTVASAVYTGAETAPQVTVAWNGRTLKAGTDYTVSYADNVEVGVGTATVTGKGNFTGSVTETFDITVADVAQADVTGLSDQVFTGKAIKPTPTVKMGSKTLASGTDYALSYSNNVNVGTASISIVGKGNYAGTLDVTFAIVPAGIAEAKVSAISDQTYTGESIKPAPEVKLGDKLLKAGSDYTVEYANNTEIGTATVTVTGKGNYAGTASCSFRIVEPAKVDLVEAVVEVKASCVYDGLAKEPALKVTLSGAELAVGTDYDVTYANNVDAGTATATLVGKGHYTGTKKVSFTISPASIGEASVSVASQAYTGKAHKPTPTVKLGSDTLVQGTDYTVVYKNNTNAGTATATVTGKGNYKGTATGTFTIAPKSVTVTAQAASKVYGDADPELTAKVAGLVGADTVNYALSRAEGENVGSYAITATGAATQGNYAVSFKGATLTVDPKDISTASVAVAKQTFSGKALTPVATVKDGSKTLKSGTDYTATYANNTEVGTANVTVTGKGNYTGTAVGTFEIAPANLSAAKIAKIADQTYTGTALTPAPTVTLGSTTLKAGTDYTVAYGSNTNAGTANVTVTGKGNYTGTVKGTFAIKPASIAKATVTVEDQPWSGKALTPAPTVKLGSVTLKADADYTVAYADNTNVGTATITVTGKGNYTGTAKGTFKVTELPNPFIDVNKSTSHYEDILWLAHTGISAGWDTPAGKEFRPNKPVARGDMAAFLFRLAKTWGVVEDGWTPKGTYKFVDVTATTSHRNEILWMAESGISTGWSTAKGAEFRPNDPVKRGQMAAFMQRLAVQVAGRKGGAASAKSFFKDVTGSTSFHDEIWWLAGNGVTQGWGSGSAREYRPNDEVKRGDMAAFLHRLDSVK